MSNLTLVIQGDASRAVAAVDATGKALDGMGAKGAANSRVLVDTLGAQSVRAANDAGAAVTKFGSSGEFSARQISAQMKYLPKQFDDAFRSISAGASPMSVLFTQGSQLRDMFGGVRPALAAIGTLITPLAIGFGTLAASVGGLAYAMYSGAEESKALDTALRSNGGWAGMTHGQIDGLTASLARNGDITVGSAREITAALVEAGQLSGPALASAGAATATLARVTGKSAADIVASLSGLSEQPAQAALKLNQAYHFLTPAVYEQVAALQAQNQQQEAAKVVLDALNNKFKNETVPNLGLIEKAAKATGEAFSGMWAAAKNIGADQTLEQQLAAVEAKLAAAAKRKPGTAEGNFAASYMDVTGAAGLAQSNTLQLQADGLRRGIAAQDAAAVDKAAKAKADADALEALSSGHQSALIAIDGAGSAVRLAQMQSYLDAGRSAARQAFDEGRIQARDYQAWLLATDIKGADAEIANIERLRAAEAGRQGLTKPDELLAQQAALQKFDAQTIAAQSRRAKIIADEAAGRRDITPHSGPALEGDGIRAQRAADSAAVEADLKARVAASAGAEQDMLASSKTIGIALIQDDHARGMAQIALDEKVLAKRLDLAAQSAADRERIEGELATWRVQRERQLTDQLKPQWQRLTDGWADTTKLMKDTSDQMLGDLVTGSEDAFATFVTTGQLNIKQLATSWVAELAKMEFRQTFTPSVLSAGKSALAWMGLPQGGSGNAHSGDETSANFIGPVAEKLSTGASDLTNTAQAFDSPIAGLTDAAGGMLRSALGWLLPQNATTAAATQLMGAAGALQAAASSLEAGGAGGSAGGIGGFLGSLFGGGGGAAGAAPALDAGIGGGLSASTVGMFLHSGGIAGAGGSFTRSLPASTWHTAPRYHSGGLAGDEVPSVLLQGEGVFTAGQMRAIGRGMSRNGASSSAAAQPQVSLSLPTTINIDARADAAAIAQMVGGAMSASERRMWAALKSKGIAR